MCLFFSNQNKNQITIDILSESIQEIPYGTLQNQQNNSNPNNTNINPNNLNNNNNNNNHTSHNLENSSKLDTTRESVTMSNVDIMNTNRDNENNTGTNGIIDPIKIVKNKVETIMNNAADHARKKMLTRHYSMLQNKSRNENYSGLAVSLLKMDIDIF